MVSVVDVVDCLQDAADGYGTLLKDVYRDQQKVFSMTEWRGLAELSAAFPVHDPRMLSYLWQRHQSWDAVCAILRATDANSVFDQAALLEKGGEEEPMKRRCDSEDSWTMVDAADESWTLLSSAPPTPTKNCRPLSYRDALLTPGPPVQTQKEEEEEEGTAAELLPTPQRVSPVIVWVNSRPSRLRRDRVYVFQLPPVKEEAEEEYDGDWAMPISCVPRKRALNTSKIRLATLEQRMKRMALKGV